MGGLLPFRSDSPPKPSNGARLIDLDKETAEEVLDSIASETTREVLLNIYDEPATASDIAEQTGLSLQNVRYHLEKLQNAELIEVGDTWYSEQGNEMKVYVPTNTSIVVVAGDEPTKTTLLETLERLLVVVGILAITSVVLDRILRYLVTGDGGFSNTDRDALGGIPSPTTPTPTAGESALPYIDISWLLSPGVAFFLGGLFMLALVAGWSSFQS